MEYEVRLPHVNKNGYYEIRLESIGGFGANLCGKMLGELGAVYLNLNAASFSSYGSEKRGSPVKAYIRYSDKQNEIRINAPIKNPDVLGIFHYGIIKNEMVREGIHKNIKIAVNSYESPDIIRKNLKLYEGSIYSIDALKIAMEVKSRINMVMLGALARVSSFIPLEAVLALAKDTIGKKYPKMLEANLEGIKRGYQEVDGKFFSPEDGIEKINYQEQINDWGWNNAPIGGINPIPGSTITNDVSSSREGYLPILNKEKCIHCGLCDITCPDMVFQFRFVEKDGIKKMTNLGLDYQHCKGCLRCVEICPTKALTIEEERNYKNPPYDMENQDLIRTVHYEKTGANSSVIGESHLTEKRVDGGIL